MINSEMFKDTIKNEIYLMKLNNCSDRDIIREISNDLSHEFTKTLSDLKSFLLEHVI